MEALERDPPDRLPGKRGRCAALLGSWLKDGVGFVRCFHEQGENSRVFFFVTRSFQIDHGVHSLFGVRFVFLCDCVYLGRITMTV